LPSFVNRSGSTHARLRDEFPADEAAARETSPDNSQSGKYPVLNVVSLSKIGSEHADRGFPGGFTIATLADVISRARSAGARSVPLGNLIQVKSTG